MAKSPAMTEKRLRIGIVAELRGVLTFDFRVIWEMEAHNRVDVRCTPVEDELLCAR